LEPLTGFISNGFDLPRSVTGFSPLGGGPARAGLRMMFLMPIAKPEECQDFSDWDMILF